MRLTEHPAELRISATTMIPLISNQKVRVSGTESQWCREPGATLLLPAEHGNLAVGAVVAAVGPQESRHIFLRRRDQQSIARLGCQLGAGLLLQPLGIEKRQAQRRAFDPHAQRSVRCNLERVLV